MKELIEFLTWLLSLFAGSILACQLAYASTVIQDLKAMAGLSEDKQLPKWRTWFKPIGFLIKEFKDLTNCPFCLSFWTGLIINFRLWDLTIEQSIVYALLSLPMVEIYRRLTL
jgi:hypothetical protein